MRPTETSVTTLLMSLRELKKQKNISTPQQPATTPPSIDLTAPSLVGSSETKGKCPSSSNSCSSGRSGYTGVNTSSSSFSKITDSLYYKYDNCSEPNVTFTSTVNYNSIYFKLTQNSSSLFKISDPHLSTCTQYEGPPQYYTTSCITPTLTVTYKNSNNSSVDGIEFFESDTTTITKVYFESTKNCTSPTSGSGSGPQHFATFHLKENDGQITYYADMASCPFSTLNISGTCPTS